MHTRTWAHSKKARFQGMWCSFRSRSSRRIAKRVAITGALVAMSVVGGSRPVSAAVTPPTQPYLMAFHTCAPGASDCNNPANHIVQLAQSADGTSWSLVPGWTSYKGSVPDVFRRGNTLYVISTSGLTKVDMTTGATTTSTVTLSEGSFVDPSLAQLPDGRLILFFLPGVPGQDPAQCAQGESSCVRQIRSAVEVAGSDGTQFTVDAGARVTETITSGAFSDPDIFFNGTEWVLYVSRGPSVHAYTSSTLQGTYGNKTVVSNNLGGVPGALVLANGTVATYVHTSSGSSTEIRMGTSATGTTAIATFQTALTGQSVGLGSHAESPGVAPNTAGIACAACAATTATTAPSMPTASAPSSLLATAPATKVTPARLGAKCTKVGQLATSGTTKLKCKKVGKKLVWAKR